MIHLRKCFMQLCHVNPWKVCVRSALSCTSWLNQPHCDVFFLFQARLFDEPQLASLCLENIDKNTGDALAAEGFTDIDLGNVI